MIRNRVSRHVRAASPENQALAVAIGAWLGSVSAWRLGLYLVLAASGLVALVFTFLVALWTLSDETAFNL